MTMKVRQPWRVSYVIIILSRKTLLSAHCRPMREKGIILAISPNSQKKNCCFVDERTTKNTVVYLLFPTWQYEMLLKLFAPFGIFGLLFYWYRRRSVFNRHFNRIPSAPNYPVVGTLPFMPKETTGKFISYILGRLQTIFIDWVKKYGRIFCVWRGSVPIVFVSAPEYAEVKCLIKYLK